MFIKTTKTKGYEYIKLVESYRDENNVTRHNVLFNFGRADTIKGNKSFIKVVKRLCEITEISIKDEPPKLNCSEAELLKYGYLPYLKLWEELGIGNCLRKIGDSTKCEYSLEYTTFQMVVQHLLLPKSKLATYLCQDEYAKLCELDEIKLHQLYRSLDQLHKNKERIEDELFKENYVKVGNKVDVVFYDVTTFAFESVVVDELKNFGFSKACKFNEVQVVMGLLIDSNGFPIGYELFPGNTFDGKTMTKALANVKKRFGINKVIIVADRGLNSKMNLVAIKAAGHGYIVASKIKGMAKSVQDLIFDNSHYIDISTEQNKFKYKIIDHINVVKDDDGVVHNLQENLVVSYSQKRAAKDAKDRQRLIEKAEKLLENPQSIKAGSKRGGKKYLAQDSDKTVYSLDKSAIERDSKFDGYYGIQTSEKSMSADEIIEAYHTLWKIEESFRIMKSTLEVRPIFHWKPERIYGHFVVCFLSFMLERKLEFLLDEQGVANSPEQIKEALNSMMLAKVDFNGEETYVKAKNKPLANAIFKVTKLKLPQNLSTRSQITELLEVGVRKSPWGQLSLF